MKRRDAAFAAIALLIFLPALLPVVARSAEIVTVEEAYHVAENWISLMIHAQGAWGESPTASVGQIEELRRGDRLLGYWCHVEPTGHIVVSIRKELAPVRANSATWDGDPGCDVGIVDVIKYKMAAEHAFIEEMVGPVETAPGYAIENLAEFSYRDTWEFLNRGAAEFKRDLHIDPRLTNYLEGYFMFTTNWSQDSPYNWFCPVDPVCVSPSYDGRCATGCVATAAAQIMKYWSWPPYGVGHPYDDPYNWTYMPDSLTTASPQYQIDAVANLMSEIGLSCFMNYCANGEGCGSGASHVNMLDAFEDYFRYHTNAHMRYRNNYDQIGWWDLIVQQLNVNRPLQYHVPEHSIVCDGWRGSTVREYHMNYGWAGWVPPESCWDWHRTTGSNTWFLLDNLPCSTDEFMIVGLQPDVSLDALLGPVYGNNPGFPYRYINVDATGAGVTFSAGQLIQFLPGTIIRGTSMSGAEVKIYGTPSLITRLFTRGDITKGVRVENGGMAFTRNGAILMY